MAIYRFRGQYVGRGQKRLKNCVKAAAYRAGVELVDPLTGERYDPRDDEKKHAVVHSEILAPEGSPSWVYDRQQLWGNAELARNRKMGITAREITIALPRELSREQQLEVMRSFLKEEFVSHGMVVDWNLHDDPGNPHVHLMLTTRRALAEGFAPTKERAWDNKRLYDRWREQWAVYANRALERAGHEERIDHRSYKERGINLEPQPKRYHDAGEDTRDAKTLEWARQQGELILADPSGPIRAVTFQRATFAREHLLKFVHERTASPEQRAACERAVMGSPELVELPTGRYTSREMLEVEKRLLDAGDTLALRESHAVSRRHLEQAVQRAEQRLASEAAERGDPPPKVSEEQRHGIAHLTGSGAAISLLEGHAGTGKSFLLGVAREAWEAAGYEVVGGALAGTAADGLQTSSGIASRTLASWERAWQLDYDHLTSKHVLVIDEAGMLGTRQLERVLEHAREAGAKVVLVGDSHQLQPIEAGSPFRALRERLGAATLEEVRRQRVDWQKRASMDFARRQARQAVHAYAKRGHVTAHLTSEQARSAVVKAWTEGLKTTAADKQLMFAFRRDDVHALNVEAREVYRARGALTGDDVQITATNGVRHIARGERVYFGRNDRDLGVKNGTLGTVEHVDEHRLIVRLDGGTGAPKRVTVDLEHYPHVDHAYAVTIHKSQGATLDRGYVLASKLFDSAKSYVSMSRHRDHLEMHWARDEFGKREELMHALTRERPKELAIEHLAEHSVTLRDVVANEKLFEFLSPVQQRAMIDEAERARTELGRPVSVARDLNAQVRAQPEVRSADEKLAKACERLQEAEKARAAYEASPWTSKRPGVAQELDQRVHVARVGEQMMAQHVREAMADPDVVERAKQQLLEHNARWDALSERVGQWREHVAGVEREGVREHVLEQAELQLKREVRWSIAEDAGQTLKHVDVLPQSYARVGHDRVGVFERPDGQLVLHEVRLHETMNLKQGDELQLTADAKGVLQIESPSLSRGIGFSR